MSPITYAYRLGTRHKRAQMSALGQKQTFELAPAMSALPLEADIRSRVGPKNYIFQSGHPSSQAPAKDKDRRKRNDEADRDAPKHDVWQVRVIASVDHKNIIQILCLQGARHEG